MENTYVFKIYYDKKFVTTITAHTKWEAIDNAFYRYFYEYDRKKINATRLQK